MARAWAGGRTGSARPEDAGDPWTAEALRQRAAAQGDTGEIAIPPEDADAVRLFFSLSTQWRRAGLSGLRVGLDYAALPAAAAGLELTMTPALFADIRTMEAAAAKEFAA